MNILRIKRKSKVNSKKILLVIFSLIMTTFAWFTYSKILNSGMLIHIDSWNLDFYIDENGNGQLDPGEEKENPIGINISDLYPGMPEQTTHVIIKNTGETDSQMAFALSQIMVLGEVYDILLLPPTDETKENYIIRPLTEHINPDAPDTEPDIYRTKIIDDSERFPFKIIIEHTNLVKQGEEGFLDIKVSWPAYATYEASDTEEIKAQKDKEKDDLDSKWGYKAAYHQYANSDPEKMGAIRLKININALGLQRASNASGGGSTEENVSGEETTDEGTSGEETVE